MLSQINILVKHTRQFALATFPILVPVSIGIVAFWVVIGPQALDPRNFAWIHGGDMLGAYLAWRFFRFSPWSFPLGANPDYGLDLANSIVYSDSNNLFAFIFKLFSDYLPTDFQYFGIWIAVCFILQAYFAWKLINLFTDNRIALVTGTVLFVFAPPMLWRLLCHYSLVAHFAILAALYFYFRKSYSSGSMLAWFCLLFLTLLIHFYIFAMVAGIYVAFMIDGVLNKSINIKSAILNASVIFALSYICMYVIGYFTAGHAFPAHGFGFYKMNLLSIIIHDKWSWILPNIPYGEGEYEGFNYLGPGGVALLLIAVWKAAQIRFDLKTILKSHVALFIICCLFALYALSNVIALGPIRLLIFPRSMYIFPDILRASGRFFWPCWYLILLFGIIAIANYFSWRKCAVILITCTILQLADTSHAWLLLREGEKNIFNRDAGLVSPFWRQAAGRYKHVRGIPVFEMSQAWPVMAAYATKNNLSTDIIYLTRYSQARLDAINARNDKMLAQGKFDADTFYILNDKTFEKAKTLINPATDLLAIIDGWNVLAPGFLSRKPAAGNEEPAAAHLQNLP